MEPQNRLYRGTDEQAGVEYLLTVFPDGHHELAQRPKGSPDSWSPPLGIRQVTLLAVTQ
jgi:hypothetical protein